jgi:hypothetical protein
VWFFNPLAWQLLFVIGAACSFAGITGRPLTPFSRWLLGPAVVVVIVSAVVKLSWTIHGVYDPFPALLLKPLWPINKTNLVPIRLVHFLAVSIVVVHLVSTESRFLRWRSARPIIICGQQSLPIFCLGILLSVLGHFVLTEWSGRLPAQIAVNVVGFALMIGMAALVTWYRATDRAQAGAVRPSAPPARSLGSS